MEPLKGHGDVKNMIREEKLYFLAKVLRSPRNFVFPHKTFAFPIETLSSFAKLLCSLRANAKFLRESKSFVRESKAFASECNVSRGKPTILHWRM